MMVRQKLVSKDMYNIKCPYEMPNPETIVVHNTANDASAENEVAYMIRNTNTVSFHFAVDDKEVVQGIPLNRNSWHSGDGAGGKGNRKGISIEICYSKSGGERFEKAEQNAAKFIAELLKERNWGIDRVSKHQDYSNKYCPHRTLDMGWDRFLKMIEGYMTPDVLYKVQVGAYAKKENADAMLEKLKKAGFSGFIVEVKKNDVKEEEPEKTEPKKSIDELAKEVINGDWGNGSDRKNRLTAAGYDYSAVQKKVDELLADPKTKSIDEIAREVINGKWGNGSERKRRLTEAGYDYSTVQKRVNELI